VALEEPTASPERVQVESLPEAQSTSTPITSEPQPQSPLDVLQAPKRPPPTALQLESDNLAPNEMMLVMDEQASAMLSVFITPNSHSPEHHLEDVPEAPDK
jgi:hypothetical protein